MEHAALPAVSLASSTTEAAHSVYLYDDGAFPDGWVGDFLMTGLAQGEGAVVVATPEHAEAIRRRLARRGAPLEALERAGRVRVLDAEATLATIMRQGRPDPALFSARVGELLDQLGGRVCAFGEMVMLLNQRGNAPAAIALEGLWNQLLTVRPVRLACAYPAAQFAGAEQAGALASVCDAHDEVAPARRLAEALRVAARRTSLLRRRTRSLTAKLREERAAFERRNDELMAVLGHELRNPLAPILAALDRLDRQGDRSWRREHHIIRRQSEHLGRLVGDLLDVSAMLHGQGTVALDLESLELGAVLARAAAETAALLAEKDQELTMSLPPSGLTVRGDAWRLGQVFTHLLGNAAKYTDRDGHVQLCARREENTVVVDVSDTGRGISAELLPVIFEPFVQGARVVDHARGGLGLGLTRVKRLVELHGGTVRASSAGPGQGSTFTVRLPAVPETRDERRGPPRQEGKPPPPPRPAALRRRRVLLVDDNRDVVEVLADGLRDEGYAVMVAYDASEALRCAAESPPDAALLDLGLPEMDGYELARRLRAGRPREELRLVAFSGYGLASDRARSDDAGFDYHLVKPATLEQILQALAVPSLH